MEYGGSSSWYWGDDRTNLLVRESTVAVTNAAIRQSGGWGFCFCLSNVTGFGGNTVTANASGQGYLYGNDAGELDAGSSYSGNATDFVVLESDNVVEDQTRQALDVPFLLVGAHEIDAHVTVQPGAELRFAEGASLMVSSTGALTANGTASDPILFTGQRPVRGHWMGISFDRTDSPDNLLNHVTVEYGGRADR